ncbi:hypothetical protein ABG79_00125 [Caloramator mitchellensis]|uniref:Uncharacterized protein n=1 Tax=Caloramator mitchellensis TaxID=908809 RepID=A0A0R3JWR4_CALMK|nr:hypothetical protein [Caloramator mitchellensis]KRQ87960.1 hypothetical protein ABG79_00125 [Caloramator mitchellensis]
MQRREDELDLFIKNSFEDIKISNNYNAKLFEKLNGHKNNKSISIPGVCFITSGVLLILMNLTNYYYRFFEWQYTINAELNILFQNINKLLGV